ncbi:acetylserotonin O-methyltransferase [Leopardus geoffroyi]|uniref:acetylserotonin O-methyltransferase n=1 Tax=Leopardus geoffroyi TaxID=46844 RepID=UPI001E264331|nr:acetylserotonin O-methyltransferase [Leopardus geoffroyi]
MLWVAPVSKGHLPTWDVSGHGQRGRPDPAPVRNTVQEEKRNAMMICRVLEDLAHHSQARAVKVPRRSPRNHKCLFQGPLRIPWSPHAEAELLVSTTVVSEFLRNCHSVLHGSIVSSEITSLPPRASVSVVPRALAHRWPLVSEVLFAACELGVFDLLSEAPEPLGSAAVAVRLGTSSHGTQLLLDTCVSLKLLQVETSRGKALYKNTELSSTYLVRASPKYQGNMLLYLARTTYLCWGHLAQAVRDGKNQYQEAFGVPSNELFTAIYRSEGERVQFMRGLQDVWSVSGRAVLEAFDLSPFRLICDVGGCSGALAKECTALYPGCRVTVFDTPDVVRAAKEHFSFLEDDRIRFWEGDFFEDPLPEADLYVLARVLHDWSDARCARLLARIRQACKPGGAVLVIESLLDADGRGPLTTQLYSLNMLVQTEGRERTPAQYLALLGPAGFWDVQYRRTGGLYDAILGRTGLPAGCS